MPTTFKHPAKGLGKPGQIYIYIKFLSTWRTNWLTSVQLISAPMMNVGPWSLCCSTGWGLTRTSIADGNTWNHEHIATLGRTLTSDVSRFKVVVMPVLYEKYVIHIPSSENLIGFMLYILWLSHIISISNANWKLHNRCSQRLERYKEITVHSNQSASDLSFSGTHWPGHVPRSLPTIIKANQTKKWRLWQFHCRNCSWEPPRRWNLSNKIKVYTVVLIALLIAIYIYKYI
jgi:hypothetical protein